MKSTPSNPLIKIDHVSLDGEKGSSILQDVSFTVNRQQIVTVIGPNGAGKTSLLRVVLGLLPATSGSIQRQTGLKVGYMPQKLTLNPLMPLTVERFLGLSSSKRNSALIDLIQETLAEVGASHLSQSSLSVLSGGEFQRVLLAQALMGGPDLLVLDEPTQGVDIIGQAELYSLIAKIRNHRGCGVLLVSHELHMVMAASDEVLCLNKHVCCSGHPTVIAKDPNYQALFGPAVSEWVEEGLAPYTHHHDHRHDGNHKYD